MIHGELLQQLFSHLANYKLTYLCFFSVYPCARVYLTRCIIRRLKIKLETQVYTLLFIICSFRIHKLNFIMSGKKKNSNQNVEYLGLN